MLHWVRPLWHRGHKISLSWDSLEKQSSAEKHKVELFNIPYSWALVCINLPSAGERSTSLVLRSVASREICEAGGGFAPRFKCLGSPAVKSSVSAIKRKQRLAVLYWSWILTSHQSCWLRTLALTGWLFPFCAPPKTNCCHVNVLTGRKLLSCCITTGEELSSTVLTCAQCVCVCVCVWMIFQNQQKCIAVFALLCCFAVLMALIFSSVDIWGDDEDGITEENCSTDCR